MAAEETELKRRRRTKTRRKPPPISTLSDELLIDIFLRLPDSRAVLQSTAVCKRWRSVISGDLDFGIWFTKNRRHNLSAADTTTTTTIFNYTSHLTKPYFYELSSKHRRPRLFDLSFMRDHTSLTVRASCDDLLLVSYSSAELYICNPRTRLWLRLPFVPRDGNFSRQGLESGRGVGSSGSALVSQCHPESDRYRFVVILICQTVFRDSMFCCSMAVFDSEAGVWTQPVFEIPCVRRRMGGTHRYRNALEVVVTGRGIVHWLDGVNRYFGLAAFDPFVSRLRLIPLPAGHFKEVNPVCGKSRIRVGVVDGRLRLSKTCKISKTRFTLLVWELDSDDHGDSWLLVHDLVLRPGSDSMSVLAFDAFNGDTMFLVCDKEIVRYEVGQERFEAVCEFPCHGGSAKKIEVQFSRYLNTFTLVHPVWPTSISWLESTMQ